MIDKTSWLIVFEMQNIHLYTDLVLRDVKTAGGLKTGIKYLSRPRGFYSSVVRNELPEDYIHIMLDNTNIIVIQRDIINNKEASIRGFALLELEKDTLSVLILGTAAYSMETRSANKVFGRGKDIIEQIKNIAINNRDKIELYAIDNSILYYYQYGWRFIRSRYVKERACYTKIIEDLKFMYKNNYKIENNKYKLNRLYKFTKITEELLSHDDTKTCRINAYNNGFRMTLYI